MWFDYATYTNVCSLVKKEIQFMMRKKNISQLIPVPCAT